MKGGSYGSTETSKLIICGNCHGEIQKKSKYYSYDDNKEEWDSVFLGDNEPVNPLTHIKTTPTRNQLQQKGGRKTRSASMSMGVKPSSLPSPQKKKPSKYSFFSALLDESFKMDEATKLDIIRRFTEASNENKCTTEVMGLVSVQQLDEETQKKKKKIFFCKKDKTCVEEGFKELILIEEISITRDQLCIDLRDSNNSYIQAVKVMNFLEERRLKYYISKSIMKPVFLTEYDIDQLFDQAFEGVIYYYSIIVDLISTEKKSVVTLSKDMYDVIDLNESTSRKAETKITHNTITKMIQDKKFIKTNLSPSHRMDNTFSV